MLPNVAPPRNLKVPPPRTSTSSAKPPDMTVSRPPLLMMVPLAVPPEDTSIVPPPKMVPESAVPADDTISVPPKEILVPLSVPPRSTMAPALLTVAPVAEPPAEMMRAPLLPERPTFVLSTSVSIARPPEFTNSRPVLIRVVADAMPPLFTVSWAWTLPLPLTVSLNVVPPSPLKVRLTLPPALIVAAGLDAAEVDVHQAAAVDDRADREAARIDGRAAVAARRAELVLLTVVLTAEPPANYDQQAGVESIAPDGDAAAEDDSRA